MVSFSINFWDYYSFGQSIMPTYSYRCHRCEVEFDIVKSHKEYNTKEICEECGMDAEKVFCFNGGISADNSPAYFNHGLGKVVRSKKDIREELSRIKTDTGREIVEIGNDRSKPKKPKGKDIDLSEVTYMYKKELKKWRH